MTDEKAKILMSISVKLNMCVKVHLVSEIVHPFNVEQLGTKGIPLL